ncbi:ATP-binding protein [Streptomyces sp. NPDC005863]|uniref:ATP-binding protein n=1 Tax=unclassified Streptomyces TaxID=2593676 RepID=UPI0033FCBD25
MSTDVPEASTDVSDLRGDVPDVSIDVPALRGDVPDVSTGVPALRGERGHDPAIPAAPALPATAAEARQQVAGVLRAWADGPGAAVGERARADILLVVSELVTNALRHGGGVTRFDADMGDEGIRVTVGDRSADLPRHPDPRRPRARGEGGYGWFLVRELATEITLVLGRTGKDISVTLPLR